MAQGSSPPTISQPALIACVHQLQRAGPAQQPRLREGDELDVDDVAPVVARRHHALDAPQPVLGVDIDMAADMGRAHQRATARLPGRLARRLDVEPLLVHALIVDLVEQPRADLVGVPGQAPQALVEMGVRLDQPGDDDLAAAVLDGDTGGRRRCRRRDLRRSCRPRSACRWRGRHRGGRCAAAGRRSSRGFLRCRVSAASGSARRAASRRAG